MTDKLPQFPGKTRLKQRSGAKRSKFEHYLQACIRDQRVTASPPFNAFLKHFVWARGRDVGGGGGSGDGGEMRVNAERFAGQ